jgi:adenylate kinase
LLSNSDGFVHISTGDLFRDAARNHTELGMIADQHIRQGKFVPDELVVKLVREKLNLPEVKEKGVILDGFPRTERQARILASSFHIDRLILFQIPDAVCVDRVLGRRVDPDTGDVYHLQFMPPSLSEISSRLVRREYDLDEKVIRKRIEGYYAQLGHILGHFKNKIQVVNAFLPPDEVHQSILTSLHQELSLIDSTQALTIDQTPASAAATAVAAPPSQLCIVCYDAPADFLVVPCGHQCACQKCLDELRTTTGLCPICRTNIQHIVQVFTCGFDEETTEGKQENTIDQIGEVRRVADVGGWADDVNNEEPAEEPVKTIQDDVSLSISPGEDVLTKSMTESVVANVAITIQIPEHKVREPVDICCIVDVSGSMSNRASYENEAGVQVDDGLSMLDIVVHSVKSVVHLLKENDRLVRISPSLLLFLHPHCR